MNIIGNVIQFDELHSRLDEAAINEAERAEIISIVEDTLFHRFLDVILTDLAHEDRVFVLERLAGSDHLSVIEFVKTRKPDIHIVVTNELETLKQEILAELG